VTIELALVAVLLMAQWLLGVLFTVLSWFALPIGIVLIASIFLDCGKKSHD